MGLRVLFVSKNPTITVNNIIKKSIVKKRLNKICFALGSKCLEKLLDQNLFSKIDSFRLERIAL